MGVISKPFITFKTKKKRVDTTVVLLSEEEKTS